MKGIIRLILILLPFVFPVSAAHLALNEDTFLPLYKCLLHLREREILSPNTPKDQQETLKAGCGVAKTIH